MTMVAQDLHPFRPPAPAARTRPLNLLGWIYTLWTNPIEAWTRAHFEEPIVVSETSIGRRVSVADPAGVRRVLLDNAFNYRRDRLQLRLLKPFAGEGLLTYEGEAWRAQRRMVAPLFSPRQVSEFSGATHRVARALVERIAAAPAGRPIAAHTEMALTTLQVLEQTLFSSGLGSDASAFQRAVTQYIDTFGRVDPLDLLGAPQFLPRLARLSGKRALKFFDATVDQLIAERRRLIASGAQPPSDLLTSLLRSADPETGKGMTEREVRSNIIVFIATGHETTANALTWSLYLLSQSAQWRARVEKEIDTAFDPTSEKDPSPELPVTRAVIEEAMRLYPPINFVGREAIGEDVVCGVRIAPGNLVSVAPYVVHRHQKLWKDPELFDPGRFLGANRDRIDRFAYIPFGVGPRVCIGMAFALQEATIVLAHLMRRFRFELAPGCVVTPVARITLRPKNGLRLVFKERN